MGNLESGSLCGLLFDSLLFALRLGCVPGTCTACSSAGSRPNSVTRQVVLLRNAAGTGPREWQSRALDGNWPGLLAANFEVKAQIFMERRGESLEYPLWVAGG